ncbi:AI-2E family transporter [Methanococcus voltae]|uniref:PurR-regulated permease PerM n=2 Tax=Methanococcus voltae TaxID=2188 RepID=A0ABT2EUS3_METVO|nr:AI-2E family transporter [Methanococcus voltae]MBP2172063.1 putative PurR-regulated permease PerM [Methanococcus voltae]MBP2200980.1 putative PurR-regulated permease PerM [Methanococcus voltae]MCS3921704.1 putative PurR-regulated permease PerM [Methanococcus voltae PS]
MKDSDFNLILKLGSLFSFILMVYILLPFIDAISFGIAFAYITKPAYDLFKKRFSKSTSAILSILVLTIPVIATILIILEQLIYYLLNLDVTQLSASISTLITKISIYDINLTQYWAPISADLFKFLEGILNGLLSQLSMIPLVMIKVLIILFMTYYFLKDGHKLLSASLVHVPECYQAHVRIFAQKLNDFYKNMFTGTALTSLIAMVIAILGYQLMGVPSALALGVLTGICVLLPVIGGWGVYMPLAIYYLIQGNIIYALAIYLFGTIFLSFILDFYIRPKVVKSGGNVHPVMTLAAFLIAPLTLGIAGFALGPIIVGAFDSLYGLKDGEISLINLRTNCELSSVSQLDEEEDE